MDPASAGLGTDVWTLKAEVILITSSGDLVRQVGDVVDVRFSDYAATLTTPVNRSTEPEFIHHTQLLANSHRKPKR